MIFPSIAKPLGNWPLGDLSQRGWSGWNFSRIFCLLNEFNWIYLDQSESQYFGQPEARVSLGGSNKHSQAKPPIRIGCPCHIEVMEDGSSTPLLSLWTPASHWAPTPKSLKSWELDLTGDDRKCSEPNQYQINQFSTEKYVYKSTHAYKCPLITYLPSTFLDLAVCFPNLFTMLFCPSDKLVNFVTQPAGTWICFNSSMFFWWTIYNTLLIC